MTINHRLWNYLENLVKASNSDQAILNAKRAIQILDQGYITEGQYKWVERIGYKPQ
jgi:two-component SAPR family response regulator